MCIRDSFHLAADAAFGADIGIAGIAPPVRAEIGLGLDERARIGDDVEDCLLYTSAYGIVGFRRPAATRPVCR